MPVEKLAVVLAGVLGLIQVVSGSTPSLLYHTNIAESNDGFSALLSDDERSNNYNFDKYYLEVLMDPCRKHMHDCCWDIYGSPEYVRSSSAMFVGWVWALGQDGDPYRARKPLKGDWESLNETSSVFNYKFQVIQADEDYVWALNEPDEELFQRKLDGSDAWKLVSGIALSYITVDSPFAVYSITKKTNELMLCWKPCGGQWVKPVHSPRHFAQGAAWDELPRANFSEKVLQVDVDITHVYCVLESGKAWVMRVELDPRLALGWLDVLDASWVDISGTEEIEFVSASSEEYLWVVTKNGDVKVCAKPCLSGSFLETPALPGEKIVRVDVDQNYVLALTELGNLYRRENYFSADMPTWEPIPNPMDYPAKLATPDDGFTFLTMSSSAQIIDRFDTFSAEREGRVCFLIKNQGECNKRKDENCAWNKAQKKCEKQVPSSKTRLQASEVVFDDPDCVMLRSLNAEGEEVKTPGYALVQSHELSGLSVIADHECVGEGVRKALAEKRPVCWDHNDTVVASNDCTSFHGDTYQYCLTVGFSSTAFIPQCGGAFKQDPNCGVFLEVHKPGPTLNQVLSEVRIPPHSSFTSGFRTTELSMLYSPRNEQGDLILDPDQTQVRTLCYGEYELWYVQRTQNAGRRDRFVEYKKKFHVEWPLCTFRRAEERYLPYHEFNDVSLDLKSLNLLHIEGLNYY